MRKGDKSITDFWNIDQTWSLFLDRDGVVNERLMGDYVKNLSEWKFIEGSDVAIAKLSQLFGYTFIVTNQQGIGKGIMTHTQLAVVHNYLQTEVAKVGGKIDEVYYAPQMADEFSVMRKPNIGMALQAQQDFFKVDFEKSVMVGDSKSDIEFGKNAGMKTVFISPELQNPANADLVFKSLIDFAESLRL